MCTFLVNAEQSQTIYYRYSRAFSIKFHLLFMSTSLWSLRNQRGYDIFIKNSIPLPALLPRLTFDPKLLLQDFGDAAPFLFSPFFLQIFKYCVLLWRPRFTLRHHQDRIINIRNSNKIIVNRNLLWFRFSILRIVCKNALFWDKNWFWQI